MMLSAKEETKAKPRLRARQVVARLHWVLGGLLLALAIGQRPAQAQVDTGSIVGTVTDTTGAIIPQAKITIKDESTGRTQILQSGQDGSYSISPLKIGEYTMTWRKPAFRLWCSSTLK